MVERRIEDGRRSEAWDESEARRSLGELARSGESIAQFARRRRVSAQRVSYWKKRLAESRTQPFVAVPLAPARVGQIEIVAYAVTIRVREDLDLERTLNEVDGWPRSNAGTGNNGTNDSARTDAKDSSGPRSTPSLPPRPMSTSWVRKAGPRIPSSFISAPCACEPTRTAPPRKTPRPPMLRVPTEPGVPVSKADCSIAQRLSSE
jgi:hypothetical protein